jgi:hypothetical protein
MRKLLSVIALGMLVGSMSGCRVAECWRYAWNSRFHPQQQQQQATVVVSEPCCVSDCCSSPCVTTSSCGCSGTPTIGTPVPTPSR